MIVSMAGDLHMLCTGGAPASCGYAQVLEACVEKRKFEIRWNKYGFKWISDDFNEAAFYKDLVVLQKVGKNTINNWKVEKGVKCLHLCGFYLRLYICITGFLDICLIPFGSLSKVQSLKID